MWTLRIVNATGETLRMTSHALDHGIWPPMIPGVIVPNSGAVQVALDTSWGLLSGSLAYEGAHGTVRIAWDTSVPLSSPTCSISCTGTYMRSASDPTGSDASGTLVTIGAVAAPPRQVAVAPAPGGTQPSAPDTVHVLKNVVKGPDGLYRGPSNGEPNEVAAIKTTPSIAQVMKLLTDAWPDLGEVGCRTVAAQWGGETGFGKYMYNYNFGNVKGADGKSPYVYLYPGAAECLSQAAFQSAQKKSPSLVFGDPKSDIVQFFKSQTCGKGRVKVAFMIPHPTTRFRAYSSYEEGAAGWISVHKRMLSKDPALLAAFQAGDTVGAAHVMFVHGYFTAGEEAYASLLTGAKAYIDKKLGPVAATSESTGATTSGGDPSTGQHGGSSVPNASGSGGGTSATQAGPR